MKNKQFRAISIKINIYKAQHGEERP